MLQQLSNTRTDKQLTRQDLSRAVYASCLNLFYDNSMFHPHPLGILYRANFYYVKRQNQDSYKHYYCGFDTGNGGSFFENGMFNSNLITYNCSLNQVKEMHPDLVCEKDGDERLLITCVYHQINFEKSKLGFFILEPRTIKNSKVLMKYQLVITPKPGLFPPKW